MLVFGLVSLVHGFALLHDLHAGQPGLGQTDLLTTRLLAAKSIAIILIGAASSIYGISRIRLHNSGYLFGGRMAAFLARSALMVIALAILVGFWYWYMAVIAVQ